MKIKFCGATTGVTGSCHLLTTENHKILLDCGQFQGGKAEEALNFEPFPFDPAEIECLVLSHAHIDHCGRIPLLVKRGFKGRIYCTSATADLLAIMLKDSAYIHEKEAEWKNRKAKRAGKPDVEPLYTQQDAIDSLNYIFPVEYDQLISLNDEMRIVFNDAGHILGSAIVEVWVREGEGEAKIVFSGDLGMPDRPILCDPTLIKKADYLIMETTYGDRLHGEHTTSIRDLLDIVVRTTRRGGNVVIPSFAVGRTQELIYEFNRFYLENEEYKKDLDRITIYIDSPMATNATEVFRNNPQVFDKETRDYILKGDNPLDFKNLKFTRSAEESQQLNFNKEPKVIISASGMCEAGRIRHHLKHNLWDSKNSIVFVGYQAAGTLGRLLLEGAKDVSLFGESIHVNAEIYNLEGFSGHADQSGLLSWLRGFQQEPKQIFLVHGEADAKQCFQKRVKEEFDWDAIAVMRNSEYRLDLHSASLLQQDEGKGEETREEDVQNVRNKLSHIHLDLEHIIYNANLAMGNDVSEEKMNKINNIIQDLEKATIGLGAAVSVRDEHEMYDDNLLTGQKGKKNQSAGGQKPPSPGRAGRGR